jgi:beta-lactamase class A
VVRRPNSLLAAAACGLAVTAAACASPGSVGPPPTAGPSSDASRAISPPDRPGPRFPGLLSYLAHRQGVITAALYDARTGRWWFYRPGVREYTASIVKVQIMGAALWQAQARGQPLPGAQAALVPPMIEASSNTAATALLADVGGPAAVLRFDRAADLVSTAPHATNPPIPGTGGLPAWGLTTTTARDQVVLLSRFAYRNPVLSGARRAYGLSLLERVEAGQNWGVSAGALRPGNTVALKDGWIMFPVALPHAAAGGWQINSIGWVTGHGRDYVLAVLTGDNPTEAYGQDTIAAIARSVYAALKPARG